MKIAIFCPNWVGDVVMATPTLRAVRQEFPRAEIVAVMRPYVADLLRGLPLVDRVLLHAPFANPAERQRQRAAAGWRFARALRRERFDSALVLTNSFRGAWWARLSGARRRVGFARDVRGCLLTETVAPPPRGKPVPIIDEYLRLARHLGCRQLSRQMELVSDPADERRLRSFWQRRGTKGFASRGVVCLNPGGAFGSSKHWPVSSFAELALRIATELKKRVLVLCGPAERNEARDIASLAGHRAVASLADEAPTLGLTIAAVRSAELLVTTDSGPRHFAPPFGVPVVTLFGPTHPQWSETFYEKSLHLQLELDCGPCQQRVCPLRHHRCMRDLGVDWAFRAATTLLAKYPMRSRAA